MVTRQKILRAQRYLINLPEVSEHYPCLESFATIYRDHLPPEYWKRHFGSETPTTREIVQGLVPVSPDEDETANLIGLVTHFGYSVAQVLNLTTIDFTLPDITPDYVLAVKLRGNTIRSVELES